MLSLFHSLKLSTRILAVSVTILVAVVAVNYVLVASKYQASAEKAMVEKAAAFTAVADSAKNHTSLLAEQGAFDREKLRAELEADIAAGKPYTESKAFNTIPVVAGWKAAEQAATKENIEFRVTAFEARNPKNEPQPGTFEHQLFADLEDSFATATDENIYRINEETNELHYLRAIKLTADCMTCHGDPATSNTGDGKDPLGFPMENWKVGDMHGAFHVVMPMAPVDTQVAGFITSGLLFTVPMTIGGALIIFLMLRFAFAKPIAALVERLADIAEGDGDLTKRVEDRRSDELGQLGKAFNKFVQKVHDLVASVQGASSEVAAASTEIAASSEQISRGLDDQQQQTAVIAASAEEMSSSVNEVANRAAESLGKAEEAGKMAAQGGEVVRQTIEDMQEIADAVKATAACVEDLGKRGEQIGAIIEVINDIADQTNLLALNAAIEAARAGEHGRGFAVVADEVRKLADRTTKATEEIAESIEAIQTGTGQAVERMQSGTQRVTQGVERAGQAGSSLESIVAGSREVYDLVQSIATSSREQSTASQSVTESVTSMSSVISESAEGSRQASEAVNMLSQKAEQLASLIGKFKLQAPDRRKDEGPVPKHISDQRIDVVASGRKLNQ
ncbi:MAG: methyl-accepting chemotaxis protein [Phycisphaeraceae bacterium]